MPPRIPKPPLTHFLCLPLVTQSSRPALEKALSSFRDEISNNADKYECQDIDGAAIRPIGTIHVTLGVFSLRSQEKIENAKLLLRDLDVNGLVKEISSDPRPLQSAGDGVRSLDGDGNESVLDSAEPMPISVSLRSLLSMQIPAKTSVLYTCPIDDTGRLTPFCKKVKNVFEEAGLLLPDSRPLKLHATVVNTIYASKNKKATSENSDSQRPDTIQNSNESGHAATQPKRSRQRNSAPLRFNATKILEQYENADWTGQFRLEKLAICKMGAQKIFDASGSLVDQTYEEVSSKDLP